MRHWLGGITAQVRLLVFGMVLLVVVAGFTGLIGVKVATATVDRLADALVPAADANARILLDMTEAESALRAWVATDDPQFLDPYYTARREVGREQLVLQQYAEQHPSLAQEAARQDAAVDDWFSTYAEPRLDMPAGDGNISHQRFVQGTEKFDGIRSANETVAAELAGSIEDANKAASRRLPWTVVILALVAVLGAIALLLARRFAGGVSEPLVDMQHTVDRLAAGDTDARTTVAGPREVRRVGEALNNFAAQNARLLVLERDAVQRLESLDRAKSDFVSNVSHELRTPLTSIAGYIELFEDGFLDRLEPEQLGMLAVVTRNVQRLQALIEDLLTLSQVESQTFRSSFDVLDLTRLVSEAAHDLGAAASGRGVRISEVHPEEPMVMSGDASQLSRALVNLVSNAVKFSHDGGEVTVRLTRSGADAHLDVVDRGIGIPAVDIDNLATRFFRASNAVDAEITGTGLGLRIVHTIVENHGGRLDVESVEGEGTRVRMVLPLAGSEREENPTPTG
ncbi:MAG: ATP-binding protein [Nocardioidaceae bacterium]